MKPLTYLRVKSNMKTLLAIILTLLVSTTGYSNPLLKRGPKTFRKQIKRACTFESIWLTFYFNPKKVTKSHKSKRPTIYRKHRKSGIYNFK